MIWCRYAQNGHACYGMVENDTVVEVEGNPFDRWETTGRRLELQHVKLLPPTFPGTFFCVGLNYRGHIAHAMARRNPVAKIPERPEVGYRANSALIGHEDEIVVPRDVAGALEAEPEIAAVIGRRIRHASRAEARRAILGWTIGNDVSARAWQNSDRTFWRAKNSDTFKPMGPWISTGADPLEATTTMRVNGVNVVSFATGEMIFNPVDYIVEITKYITMSPGDVLWMGADGTAPIAPGDTVEIHIGGIGTLRNRVVSHDGLPLAKGSAIGHHREDSEARASGAFGRADGGR